MEKTVQSNRSRKLVTLPLVFFDEVISQADATFCYTCQRERHYSWNFLGIEICINLNLHQCMTENQNPVYRSVYFCIGSASNCSSILM
jgi:hypothetical protein